MTKIAFLLLTLGLSLTPILCWATESNIDQEKAIAEVEKSGCRVVGGKDVIEVVFDIADHDPPDPKPNDTTLRYVGAFRQLQVLVLSYSDISDAGLVHLKGLTKLEELFLGCTDVTDAGLANLRGLSELRELDLTGSFRITDAGLVHLMGLKKLQDLRIGVTAVSDEGIRKLHKSLPNCVVSRLGKLVDPKPKK